MYPITLCPGTILFSLWTSNFIFHPGLDSSGPRLYVTFSPPVHSSGAGCPPIKTKIFRASLMLIGWTTIFGRFASFSSTLCKDISLYVYKKYHDQTKDYLVLQVCHLYITYTPHQWLGTLV